MLSFGLWWHVWSSHPTSTILCGCGDTAQFVWFLEWPAYALSHGLNPLYSTAAAYPHGVNLLSVTSVLAVGIPLAPITLIFGPVATLNVALLLSPALSGVAMFILLRRWVSWQPAAFVGGLAYGFSPLILTSLDFSHLNLTLSPIPPLVVACLDEIVITQRRRPVNTGILLGLLLTVQFFLSTELLVIIVMASTFGLVLVVAYTGWQKSQELRQHVRSALVGLVTGAIVAALLLAYPAWFALKGPAHLSGVVWSNPGQYVSSLKQYVVPHPALPGLGWLYGFAGNPLSDHYLGLGFVAVLFGGLVAWRRDLRLWLFAIVGLASLALSVGAANPLVGVLPILGNILPNRFDQVLLLCAAIMLGIVIDHSYDAVTRWYAARRVAPEAINAARPQIAWPGALAGLALAAIALVPVGLYFSQNVPIPVQSSERVPSWFTTAGQHLGPEQVVLVLPDNLSVESPLVWQVAGGMRFNLTDEVGARGTSAKVPPGLRVLVNTSEPAPFRSASASDALRIAPGNIADVRSVLHDWGVTMVVIPDQPGLVRLAQLPSVPDAAALITAATGQRPSYEHGAWVWSAVKQPHLPLTPTASQFSDCVNSGLRGTEAVAVADACIASTGPFVRIVPSIDGLDLMQHGLLMSTAVAPNGVKDVNFVIKGQEDPVVLSVPAHRIVDGSLTGWVANTEGLSLPEGTYAVTSVANDNMGAAGHSPSVTMQVTGATGLAPAPATRVASPAPRERVSGTKPLVATASSPLGVSKVAFRITGGGHTITKGAVPTLVGWLSEWDTRSVPNGTYTVYADAVGNTGLAAKSHGVVVEVRNAGWRGAIRSHA